MCVADRRRRRFIEIHQKLPVRTRRTWRGTRGESGALKNARRRPDDPPSAYLVTMPLSTSFESARLYGAREAFTTARGFLLDERPRVLALSSLQALEVPGLVSIGPPEALPLRPFQPDQKRSPEPAKAFNPSIALAPHGLCPRCKYAMTLRVDTLHQCDSESSPYNGGQARLANGNWFQGTVVGILDAELRLLGWTWLLNAPAYQIASADQNVSMARRAGCILAGASDGFRMSWAKQTFDARLLHWKVSAADER